jgi:hypothetical protein
MEERKRDGQKLKWIRPTYPRNNYIEEVEQLVSLVRQLNRDRKKNGSGDILWHPLNKEQVRTCDIGAYAVRSLHFLLFVSNFLFVPFFLWVFYYVVGNQGVVCAVVAGIWGIFSA